MLLEKKIGRHKIIRVRWGRFFCKTSNSWDIWRNMTRVNFVSTLKFSGHQTLKLHVFREHDLTFFFKTLITRVVWGVEKKQKRGQIERVQAQLSLIKRVSQNLSFGRETVPTLALWMPLETRRTNLTVVSNDAKSVLALALLVTCFSKMLSKTDFFAI